MLVCVGHALTSYVLFLMVVCAPHVATITWENKPAKNNNNNNGFLGRIKVVAFELSWVMILNFFCSILG